MNPRIERLQHKKLIGNFVQMSLIADKTGPLWKQFAPRMFEIQNRTCDKKISMQIYPPWYFNDFDPNVEFQKWAAVEVEDFEIVPIGMQTFTLRGGWYAVFDYKGPSTDHSIFKYIFSEWLPGSIYQLDDRPHFEVLGEKYQNNSPDSEEEIWIPISEKG